MRARGECVRLTKGLGSGADGALDGGRALPPSDVEIGHGHPLAGGVPSASRTKSMNMRVKSRPIAESLHDGDHSWVKAVFFEGGSVHELSYRLEGTTGELPQKLAVMEEVHSEHLWDR